jgi:hypothetical protein
MVPAADGMAQEFPGWHIWRSQAGRWWATRLGNMAWDQHHDPGFAMTVDADTPAELVMVLARQPQVPADPVRRPQSRSKYIRSLRNRGHQTDPGIQHINVPDYCLTG